MRTSISRTVGPETRAAGRRATLPLESASPRGTGNRECVQARRVHPAWCYSPLAWAFVLAGAASVGLSITAHGVPYFKADVIVSHLVQATDFRFLAGPMDVLNRIGFFPLAPIAYGGVVAMIFLAGARWEAAAATVAALGGMGLGYFVKALVARPRPPEDLVHVQHHLMSASFPAGHVLNFTAFAGLLCCIAWMRMGPSWRRSALVALLGSAIVLMGMARIASGEHWPSDVLGGYSIGAAWLGVSLALYRWGRARLASVGLSHPRHRADPWPRKRAGARRRQDADQAAIVAAMGAGQARPSDPEAYSTIIVDSLTRW